MNIRSILAAAVFSTAVFSHLAFAQSPADSAVTATGVGELSRLPERMRLKIVVSAKGKDTAEALAQLKDRLTAAKAQLGMLGADKASISADEPQPTPEDPNRRRQIEMLMAQRMRGGRRPTAKKEETKPPVSLSATLSAEWPLQAKSGDELLVSTAALQDKIKAADLAGLKEQSKLSPEEQELAEELQGELNMYSGDEGPKAGEPMFLFVAPIPAAEREKLLAEGFTKAKAQAARLAKAAGVELGALRSLSDNEIDASDESMGMNAAFGGYPASYRMLQMMRGGRATQNENAEAIGAQPGKLTYRVMVTASFALKNK
jgi:uncharacterized protein YggE